MGRLVSAVPNLMPVLSPSQNRAKNAKACGTRSTLLTVSDQAVTKPSCHRVLIKMIKYVCTYVCPVYACFRFRSRRNETRSKENQMKWQIWFLALTASQIKQNRVVERSVIGLWGMQGSRRIVLWRNVSEFAWRRFRKQQNSQSGLQCAGDIWIRGGRGHGP